MELFLPKFKKNEHKQNVEKKNKDKITSWKHQHVFIIVLDSTLHIMCTILAVIVDLLRNKHSGATVSELNS